MCAARNVKGKGIFGMLVGHQQQSSPAPINDSFHISNNNLPVTISLRVPSLHNTHPPEASTTEASSRPSSSRSESRGVSKDVSQYQLPQILSESSSPTNGDMNAALEIVRQNLIQTEKALKEVNDVDPYPMGVFRSEGDGGSSALTMSALFDAEDVEPLDWDGSSVQVVYVRSGSEHRALLYLLMKTNRHFGLDDVQPDVPEEVAAFHYRLLRPPTDPTLCVNGDAATAFRFSTLPKGLVVQRVKVKPTVATPLLDPVTLNRNTALNRLGSALENSPGHASAPESSPVVRPVAPAQPLTVELSGMSSARSETLTPSPVARTPKALASDRQSLDSSRTNMPTSRSLRSAASHSLGLRAVAINREELEDFKRRLALQRAEPIMLIPVAMPKSGRYLDMATELILEFNQRGLLISPFLYSTLCAVSSATTIQATWRSWRTRETLDFWTLLQRGRAAVLIQRTWRAYVLRSRLEMLAAASRVAAAAKSLILGARVVFTAYNLALLRHRLSTRLLAVFPEQRLRWGFDPMGRAVVVEPERIARALLQPGVRRYSRWHPGLPNPPEPRGLPMWLGIAGSDCFSEAAAAEQGVRVVYKQQNFLTLLTTNSEWYDANGMRLPYGVLPDASMSFQAVNDNDVVMTVTFPSTQDLALSASLLCCLTWDMKKGEGVMLLPQYHAGSDAANFTSRANTATPGDVSGNQSPLDEAGALSWRHSTPASRDGRQSFRSASPSAAVVPMTMVGPIPPGQRPLSQGAPLSPGRRGGLASVSSTPRLVPPPPGPYVRSASPSTPDGVASLGSSRSLVAPPTSPGRQSTSPRPQSRPTPRDVSPRLCGATLSPPPSRQSRLRQSAAALSRPSADSLTPRPDAAFASALVLYQDISMSALEPRRSVDVSPSQRAAMLNPMEAGGAFGGERGRLRSNAGDVSLYGAAIVAGQPHSLLQVQVHALSPSPSTNRSQPSPLDSGRLPLSTRSAIQLLFSERFGLAPNPAVSSGPAQAITHGVVSEQAPELPRGPTRVYQPLGSSSFQKIPPHVAEVENFMSPWSRQSSRRSPPAMLPHTDSVGSQRGIPQQRHGEPSLNTAAGSTGVFGVFGGFEGFGGTGVVEKVMPPAQVPLTRFDHAVPQGGAVGNRSFKATTSSFPPALPVVNVTSGLSFGDNAVISSSIAPPDERPLSQRYGSGVTPSPRPIGSAAGGERDFVEQQMLQQIPEHDMFLGEEWAQDPQAQAQEVMDSDFDEKGNWIGGSVAERFWAPGPFGDMVLLPVEVPPNLRAELERVRGDVDAYRRHLRRFMRNLAASGSPSSTLAATSDTAVRAAQAGPGEFNVNVFSEHSPAYTVEADLAARSLAALVERNGGKDPFAPNPELAAAMADIQAMDVQAEQARIVEEAGILRRNEQMEAEANARALKIEAVFQKRERHQELMESLRLGQLLQGRQIDTGHKLAPGYMPLTTLQVSLLLAEARQVYLGAVAEAVSAARYNHLVVIREVQEERCNTKARSGKLVAAQSVTAATVIEEHERAVLMAKHRRVNQRNIRAARKAQLERDHTFAAAFSRQVNGLGRQIFKSELRIRDTAMANATATQTEARRQMDFAVSHNIALSKQDILATNKWKATTVKGAGYTREVAESYEALNQMKVDMVTVRRDADYERMHRTGPAGGVWGAARPRELLRAPLPMTSVVSAAEAREHVAQSGGDLEVASTARSNLSEPSLLKRGPFDDFPRQGSPSSVSLEQKGGLDPAGGSAVTADVFAFPAKPGSGLWSHGTTSPHRQGDGFEGAFEEEFGGPYPPVDRPASIPFPPRDAVAPGGEYRGDSALGWLREADVTKRLDFSEVAPPLTQSYPLRSRLEGGAGDVSMADRGVVKEGGGEGKGGTPGSRVTVSRRSSFEPSLGGGEIQDVDTREWDRHSEREKNPRNSLSASEYPGQAPANLSWMGSDRPPMNETNASTFSARGASQTASLSPPLKPGKRVVIPPLPLEADKVRVAARQRGKAALGRFPAPLAGEPLGPWQDAEQMQGGGSGRESFTPLQTQANPQNESFEERTRSLTSSPLPHIQKPSVNASRTAPQKGNDGSAGLADGVSSNGSQLHPFTRQQPQQQKLQGQSKDAKTSPGPPGPKPLSKAPRSRPIGIVV